MRKRVRPGAWIGLVAMLAVYGAAWANDVPRYHGLPLDSQHFLFVEEQRGWATIILQKKDRAAGGPIVFYDPDDDLREVSLIRFGVDEPLVRMRAEVTLPAPPNYVSNPGNRYRITIEGMSVAPYYQRVFLVDAADALDAVAGEMQLIAHHAHGIRREAILFGTEVAMAVLNVAQNLPAQIPLTVLRSEVGQARIQGQFFGRGQQARLARFKAGPDGMEFLAVQESEFVGERDPVEIHGPAYRRGSPTPGQAARPYHHRQHRGNRDEMRRPPDPRMVRLRELGEQTPPSERPGARGRPLTAPEVDMPAIFEAEKKSVEMLVGPVDGAMKGRQRQYLERREAYSERSTRPQRPQGPDTRPSAR